MTELVKVCSFTHHASLITANQGTCPDCNRLLSIPTLKKCSHGVYSPSGAETGTAHKCVEAQEGLNLSKMPKRKPSVAEN